MAKFMPYHSNLRIKIHFIQQYRSQYIHRAIADGDYISPALRGKDYTDPGGPGGEWGISMLYPESDTGICQPGKVTECQ